MIGNRNTGLLIQVACLIEVATKTGFTVVNELPRDKTNKVTVHPAKTQISLGIRPVWSESSLCAQWVAKDPMFLHADSEDSDLTGQMPRLIWVFAGRTAHLLVLSWGSSNVQLASRRLTSWLMWKWYLSVQSHQSICCSLWEFPTRPDTNRPVQPQKLARFYKITAIESRDIILSKQRTTKALIRLSRCAGWSAPLLFAYDIRHIFSWPSSCIRN